MDLAGVDRGPPSVDLIPFRVQRSRGVARIVPLSFATEKITRVVILRVNVTAADAER
jgi:hypothetical protein